MINAIVLLGVSFLAAVFGYLARMTEGSPSNKDRMTASIAFWFWAAGAFVAWMTMK